MRFETLKSRWTAWARTLLLNALISAGVQDTGQIVDDFGEGTPGLLEEILA